MLKKKLLVVMTCAGLTAASMLATTPTASAAVSLTMFDQASANGVAGDSMPGGLWGDYGPGNASRPFVERLAVVNGGTTEVVLDGGTTTSAGPAAGDLAAVISPVNLCKTGRSDNCYTTPNRIALTFGAQAVDSLNMDVAGVSGQTVSADSIIDLTVNMNSFGSELRWSQLSGHLLYWQVTGQGTDNAKVRMKFRPTTIPAVDWETAGSNGCSATPIFDCDIARSTQDYLGASVILSVDDTLAQDLAGAVFGTERAFFGYLTPGGTPSQPVSDFQLASTHLDAGGNLNQGSLRAFIPSAALVNTYGLLPEDAADAMTTQRSGSAGTNQAPTYTRWRAADQGSDGLLVEVGGITFSAPKYQVARKSAFVKSSAKVTSIRGVGKNSKKMTRIRLGGKATSTCSKFDCTVQVRKISSATTAQTKLAKKLKLRSRNATVDVKVGRLSKRSRYLIVIKGTKGAKKGKLIATSLGSVR